MRCHVKLPANPLKVSFAPCKQDVLLRVPNKGVHHRDRMHLVLNLILLLIVKNISKNASALLQQNFLTQ